MTEPHGPQTPQGGDGEQPLPPPTGPNPPVGSATGPGAVPPARKQGASTGTKVLIGCGVFALVATVLVVVTVAGIAYFFGQGVREFAGGVQAQVEATELARELEERHPFTPPQSGEVTPEQAQRFFVVTDDAWSRIGPWLQELDARGERLRAEEDFRSMVSAMSALRGLGQARIDLIETLERHDTSVAEFLWSGVNLMIAYESLDRDDTTLPEANRELARRYRAELAVLAEDDVSEGGRGAIFALAWLFGAPDQIVNQMRDLERLQEGRAPPGR